MIDLDWLSERLVCILRWQMDHPYAGAMEEPDAPEMPTAGSRICRIFNDLNRTRGGGMGPAPITWQEIDAWSRARGEPVRSFELDIIRALDAAWLEVVVEMQKNPDRPKVRSEKMTPERFDRMFG